MIGLAGAIAALITVRRGGADPSLLWRVLQGVLMGVGFVGAGVIMHPACRRGLHGVTTAAATWMAVLVGIAAGFADWILLGFLRCWPSGCSWRRSPCDRGGTGPRRGQTSGPRSVALGHGANSRRWQDGHGNEEADDAEKTPEPQGG